jgi:lipopolysaccharide transport system permease protein
MRSSSAPGAIAVRVPLRRVIYLWDLLTELVGRDLKLRYKRSLLGLGWSLLNPLAQLLVLGVVFRLVLPLKIPHYTGFLFVGILAWTWFQSALLVSTSAIVDNRELIRQPGFPAVMLPTATVTTHLIHFLLALPVLLVFLLFRHYPLNLNILALPVVIAVQFVLILGLAHLLATVHVTFRDTQYLLGVVLLLLFYLTPVFYSDEVIPDPYRIIYSLNPLVPLLDSYRAILLDGQPPNYLWLGGLALFSAALLWFGVRVFTRASGAFAEEL